MKAHEESDNSIFSAEFGSCPVNTLWDYSLGGDCGNKKGMMINWVFSMPCFEQKNCPVEIQHLNVNREYAICIQACQGEFV